jgi:RimJ/RimL family protein N-acetyltransferase
MTEQVNLRPVTMADAEDLLVWRNDPETRHASHNTDEISLDRHLAWLEASLNKPEQRRLWIAEMNAKSVGTCRADRIDGAWELSWTVAPNFRGKGIAQKMLSAIIERFQDPLVAEIKVGNIASIKVSERAGFIFDKEEHGVLFYVFPRKPTSSY